MIFLFGFNHPVSFLASAVMLKLFFASFLEKYNIKGAIIIGGIHQFIQFNEKSGRLVVNAVVDTIVPESISIMW